MYIRREQSVDFNNILTDTDKTSNNILPRSFYNYRLHYAVKW